MKIRSLVLAIATLATVASAHAAIQTADYGSYTVSYDDSTIFGGPTFNSSGGAGSVGFGWSIPDSVNASSSGLPITLFQLPDFTISAKAGWSLSGAFTASIGNLIFVEAGGLTGVTAGGSVSVDGAPSIAFGGGLDRTVTISAPELTVGYFSGAATVPLGSFSTLLVTGGTLHLLTDGGPLGGFATIAAQPQNTLSFGFVAAPVPEPESYAMLLAGLAVVGSMARRRRQD
ncbi:MAG: PEP-CTERM sorting domain-containing protein [Ferribacterium limneticum]